MKRFIFLIVFVIFLIPSLVFAGAIGRQDFHGWDGLGGSSKFERETTGGYTIQLNDVGWVVDVLMVYGGGVNYTRDTINDALTAIGSSDNVGIVLNPGTWVIDSTLTITSNYLTILPSGVTIKPDAGVSVYIQGPVDIGNYPVFDVSASGSSVILTGPALEGIIYDRWFTDSGTTNVGLGMKPGSAYKWDISGSMRASDDITGTSLYGNLAVTGLVGKLTDAQLPSVITSPEIRTQTNITGKTFMVDLTSSETLSGMTIFGGYITGVSDSARSYTAGVTATFISPSGGENVRLYVKEDTRDSGNSLYVAFTAGDAIFYNQDFIAGTSKFIITGTTTEVIVDLWSSGLSEWVVSATSGSPTIDWD